MIKNVTKSLSMFIGAATSGPIASLLGVPIGAEMSSLLATGATSSLASILANMTTDEIKELVHSESEENHDLQKCVIHSIEKALEEIQYDLSEEEENLFGELFEEIIYAIRKSKKDVTILDELFKPEETTPTLNDYYFTSLSEEEHERLIWSGIEVILLRLHLRDGRTWRIKDDTILQMEELLKRKLPHVFLLKLRDSLKLNKFDKSWKSFQREMFMELHQFVSKLSLTTNGLEKDLEAVRIASQRCFMELNEIAKVNQDIKETLQSRFARQEQMLNEIIGYVKPSEDQCDSNEMQDKQVSPLEYINHDFLHSLEKPSREDCSFYYKGDPPSWGLIYHKYTAHRKTTDEIVKLLDKPGFQTLSLTGAGGEGKTTILMQSAVELCQKGYKVFFAKADENYQLPLDFLEDEDEVTPVVLLVDRADLCTNMADVIRHLAQKERTIKIIMSNRENVWLRSGLHHFLKKLIRNGSRTHYSRGVQQLSKEEATEIAHLLLDSGTVSSDREINDLAQSLLSDTNGFLLAAMLTTTYGLPLKEIVKSILLQIEEFDEGAKMLDVLAVISIFDLVGSKNKKSAVNLTKSLLVEIFGNDKDILKLLPGLSGELSNQRTLVSTRHESIAAIYRELLFVENVTDIPIDEEHLLDLILYTAGKHSRNYNKSAVGKLLYQIPNYYVNLENYGYEFARVLFEKSIIQDRLRSKTWVEWASLETRYGHIGDPYLEGSARYLYREATMVQPNEVAPWLNWAKLEETVNNIGTQSEEYTARWIAMQGSLKNESFQELWLKWAELEEKENNVGNVETKYSARWIYYMITKKQPKGTSWYNWAQLEYRLENYGDQEQEYSLKWIIQQGRDKNPRDVRMDIFWIELERQQKNFGSVEEPNTARWIINEALKENTDNQGGLWIIAAEIEKEVGNIGNREERHSARWYINRGLEYKKDNIGLWLLAAKIEFEQNNIGTSLEEYSCRWFLKQAEKNFGLLSVASIWGEIESNLGNVGSITIPGSARWIFWEGITTYPKNHSLWAKLINLEIKLENIGDAHTPYTAVWFYQECLKENKTFLDWDIGQNIRNELQDYLNSL